MNKIKKIILSLLVFFISTTLHSMEESTLDWTNKLTPKSFKGGILFLEQKMENEIMSYELESIDPKKDIESVMIIFELKHEYDSYEKYIEECKKHFKAAFVIGASNAELPEEDGTYPYTIRKLDNQRIEHKFIFRA